MRERESDMLFDLFKAVYADDLDSAEQTLGMMCAIGIHSGMIMRARQAARPLPRTELAKPYVLPVPGAPLGSVEPSIRANRPTRSRRKAA